MMLRSGRKMAGQIGDKGSRAAFNNAPFTPSPSLNLAPPLEPAYVLFASHIPTLPTSRQHAYNHRTKLTTGSRTHVNAIPTSMMAATEESLNLPFTRLAILKRAGTATPRCFTQRSPASSQVMRLHKKMAKGRLQTLCIIAALTLVYVVSEGGGGRMVELEDENYKPEDEAAYRKLGPVREKEDWTRYPYADPVFRDGRGPFQTVEERPISNKTDKYSYWWKVPNNMGYPSGELDARLSFPYDQSTGGKSYNAFWGGGDRIDSIAQQHKELDRWWNDDGSRPRSGEDKDYADFWGKGSSLADSLSRGTDGYRQFWGHDVALGGQGIAGAIDADPDGGSGLVKVYRKSYEGSDMRAFDDAGWQNKGQEPAFAGDGGVPKGWPRQLYHYGADGTDEDVETIGV